MKKGQIWVETVLYTLIGLMLIALVLGFMTPKIKETRDNLLIGQSIDTLNLIDSKINEVISQGEGNTRNVDFTMKKGELIINAKDNKIIFKIIGLSKPYSEPGINIPYGRVIMFSEEGAKTSSITLTLDYKNTDIVYNKNDEEKAFSSAPIPYKFSIRNEENKINIIEISRG
ncbi:MAG: hypothetical protein AABW65_03090 [Nanoarchaeota archaeon]